MSRLTVLPSRDRESRGPIAGITSVHRRRLSMVEPSASACSAVHNTAQPGTERPRIAFLRLDPKGRKSTEALFSTVVETAPAASRTRSRRSRRGSRSSTAGRASASRRARPRRMRCASRPPGMPTVSWLVSSRTHVTAAGARVDRRRRTNGTSASLSSALAHRIRASSATKQLAFVHWPMSAGSLKITIAGGRSLSYRPEPQVRARDR